jgi:tRNA-dihydrouridine synthase 3
MKAEMDDDAAEASAHTDDRDRGNGKTGSRGNDKNGKDRKKRKGQNQSRDNGYFSDAIKICHSRAFSNEFSPRECKFGDRCNMCHDLRKYLKEGRSEDVTTETFGGKCPIFTVYGRCPAGWKCRFVKSHSQEIEREDGRKELVLDGASDPSAAGVDENDDERQGVVNVATSDQKWGLARRKVKLERSDKIKRLVHPTVARLTRIVCLRSEEYIKWLNSEMDNSKGFHNKKKIHEGDDEEAAREAREALRAQFVDPPFKASEKRRIYYGRETPVLAPLTTQGNMPFRRLCVELGAQVTFSEMAMGMPLVQGQKGEWALMKAHETEITSPRFTPPSNTIVKNYDNSKDFKFGAQISANQPWLAIKATEALTTFLPHLRVIDLNCGCPINMVFETGAGSALMDSPTKLERMIRGMNDISGEVPITVKIRTGVTDSKPTASRLIERLAFGGEESRERLGAPGCAAITLHGRSRSVMHHSSPSLTTLFELVELNTTPDPDLVQ